MGFTFWFVMLILFHVALLFMVPWEQYGYTKYREQNRFCCIVVCEEYNKVIFRVGNLNKEGCRTWEQDGKKYMCFWDTVLERYTTCIDPMITYKRKVS